MTKQDDQFPIKQRYEDGRPIGVTSFDLGRAIELWFHAQARTEVYVHEAAMVFNVSPEKVAEAVEQYGSGFFWISKEPIPLKNRQFDCDGM